MESDRQGPNKACLIVCMYVCVCAQAKTMNERRGGVSGWACLHERPKWTEKCIYTYIKIHSSLAFASLICACLCADLCSVSTRIKVTINLDLRAASGCHGDVDPLSPGGTRCPTVRGQGSEQFCAAERTLRVDNEQGEPVTRNTLPPFTSDP